MSISGGWKIFLIAVAAEVTAIWICKKVFKLC